MGRTFLLANAAVWLANKGFSVLCVDWDLEAPGLSHYFSPFLSGEGADGLVGLLSDFKAGSPRAYDDYTENVDLEQAQGSLTLLPSGRDDGDYLGRLHGLDWVELYREHALGSFIEQLRSHWIDQYDLVLLWADEMRDSLPVDRPGLVKLPVPSKVDKDDTESNLLQWEGDWSSLLPRYYAPWKDSSLEPQKLLDLLRVPYSTRWSAGEPLPVLHERDSNPANVSFFVANIAAMVARGCAGSLDLVNRRTEFVNRSCTGAVELMVSSWVIAAPVAVLPWFSRRTSPMRRC